MLLSPAVRKDPSMLGQTHYARSDHDHYPTPPKATEVFIDHPAMRALFQDKIVWEPACGNGAIVKVIDSRVLDTYATDLVSYPGEFKPTALVDFYSIQDLNELRPHVGGMGPPNGIITNPPYGKDAEKFARHSLKLMEAQGGAVAFLCRHDWDTAKSRKDLFDHPAFAAKVVLRFRPRWFEGSKGAPRFSFTWFVWDWSKDPSAPPAAYYAG